MADINPYSLGNVGAPINQSPTPLLDFLIQAAHASRSPDWGLGFVRDQLQGNYQQGLAGAARMGEESGPKNIQELLSGDPMGGMPTKITHGRGRLGQLLQSLGIVGEPQPEEPSGAEQQAMVYGRAQRVDLLTRLLQNTAHIADLEERRALLKSHQEDVQKYHDLLGAHQKEQEKIERERIQAEKDIRQSTLEEKAAEKQETVKYQKKFAKLKSKAVRSEQLQKMRTEKRLKFAEAVRPIDMQLHALYAIDPSMWDDAMRQRVQQLEARRSQIGVQMGLPDTAVGAVGVFGQPEPDSIMPGDL